jgi:hypothetical protein
MSVPLPTVAAPDQRPRLAVAEHAPVLAGCGFFVFPIRPDGDVDRDGEPAAKRPAVDRWEQRHVLIRIEDLAALLAARPPDAGQPEPATPPPPRPPGGATAAWPALAAAIALLTSRIGGAGVSDADLIGDTDPATVIRALAAIATRALECAWPDVATVTVLQNLAVAVAREATRGTTSR